MEQIAWTVVAAATTRRRRRGFIAAVVFILIVFGVCGVELLSAGELGFVGNVCRLVVSD